MAVKAERGKFLTILIILGFLGWLITFPRILNLNQDYAKLGIILPQWYMPYSLILGFLQVGVLIGIWKWKKWAVYSYFTFALLSMLSTSFIFYNTPINSGIFSFVRFLSISVVGLWIWAIYRKWKYYK